MSKDDYYAAKDRLQKSVHDAANHLAGMDSPGNQQQFWREIVEEFDNMRDRVWQIAARNRG